jgi:NAD(P)-dependent dehydrogenase (short-subunit alcohol dehydrogenase family)
MFMALRTFGEMAQQGHGGTILNITSGAHLGMPNVTAYGTTKGAVASLTYNLAIEGESVGVRVNALAPVAETAMSRGQPDRPDGLNRAQPHQIAPVVVYLMSDEAAGLNGQVVRFDSQTLSLLDGPSFRTERVTDDVDSADGIARAFESAPAMRARPFGLF